MKSAMDDRIRWLKTMMTKGLRISVALEKPEDFEHSLKAEDVRISRMLVRGIIPEGLIEYLPV